MVSTDSGGSAASAGSAAQQVTPRFAFGVATDQGRRDHMEDRSCIIPDFRPLGTPDNDENASTTFCGVFDGHLSARAAEMAANNLHAHLAREPGYLGSLQRSTPLRPQAISDALQNAFLACDGEILEASRTGETWKGGSTACICLTVDAELFVAHVGDSGAFVVRGRTARRLTQDHKPTNPAERQRIANAGGRVNQELDRVYSADQGTMLAMSRALGDASFKEEGPGQDLVSNRPDVRHLALTPQDCAVVIASDGMFDVLSDQQAADVVLEFAGQQGDRTARANQAAAALVRAALDAGTHDNVTACVMLLQWPSSDVPDRRSSDFPAGHS